MTNEYNTPTVGITGGPCSGKTSGQPLASSLLQYRGYTPIFVPEAATTLILAGLNPHSVSFQKKVIKLILKREAVAERKAKQLIKKGERPVILCDRGLMDGEAYMQGLFPKEDFERLLAQFGLTVLTARDMRYKAILHLKVAPKEFFTHANNTARRETHEEAEQLDVRLESAYLGHEYYRTFGNQTTFNGKMHAYGNELLNAVGEIGIGDAQYRYQPESTFTLEQIPKSIILSEIPIEQYYITPSEDSIPGTSVRLRKRTYRNERMYIKTLKQTVNGEPIKTEDFISEEIWHQFQNRREHGKGIVEKKRYSFNWRDQIFKLDVFDRPIDEKGTRFLLQQDTNNMEPKKAELPWFIPIAQEVTTLEEYKNYAIAERYA